MSDHTTAQDAVPGRLPVPKTYKLYVGGAFPRSESGRSIPVTAPDGRHLAHAALASRKDARDAVVAARAAFAPWAARTAFNRGQILYRIAEMMEGRRDHFAGAVVDALGVPRPRAEEAVDAAVDRWIHYAGWTDKVAQVLGGANPVSGPFDNASAPEPTGVVAVFAPQDAPLLGLVSVLAPVIATGNTAVVVASESAPLPAVVLAEALATSDLPSGVVNILTGRTADVAPALAAHEDVDALDLTGAGALAADLERAAATTLTRVLRPGPRPDWWALPGLGRITPFLETKTVWQSVGR
ncbi:aldehyde dehydrogenase family protein [Streptomyces sp. NPDC005840]|uniref:Aldehyde dehydrogenase family protein n=1 Tax=Streptomyces doudnae TaxID=3075536 RepID=A0ABD5EFP6_9ACTN|nr:MULTISPECIES: aldehyde dehydrogenase family protein [unclassified Streptomyces]MDT0433219.1 aldehyde dehydrogenase family protein [Streptomyces sp. DSM 41981]MYQ68125.1 aldehyde dehydrogenase family protein [Streptomyces sp. SID4950]SCE43265.1 Aldehyde dehydrogenase family protein [Streptomyces sp. SolWspMP-5a-2]